MGIGRDSGRLTTLLCTVDGVPWVETLVARGWSLACKNDLRRVIPDFGPSDEQVSKGFNCLLFFFSPGQTLARGFYTIVIGLVARRFSVVADPCGMGRHF